LSQIDTEEGVEFYTYDAGGRIASITRDGEVWNLEYNTRDLITRITDADGELVVEYEYDSEGRRVGTLDATGSRDYLVAPLLDELESPYLVVGDETLDAFVYAGDTPLLRLDEEGNPVYYLTDAIGSVIGLADGQGQEVASFSYDSFGNLRVVEGNVDVGGDFRFQSQWLESTTDFYHLLARYYDPETGRFVSRDAIDVIETEPESANPYQFAYHNPQIYSDPSGMITFAELNTSLTIHDILNKVHAYAVNATKDYLVDQARGTLGHIFQNVMSKLIPRAWSNLMSLLDAGDVLNAGIELGNIAGLTFCFLFRNSGIEHYVWFEPRILVQTGRALTSGYNCGITDPDEQRRARQGRIRFPRGSTVNPDYIISAYPPSRVGTKDLLIGDFKLSANTLYKEYINNERNKRKQWLGISAHAQYENRFQFVPITSFFTLRPTNQARYERLEQEAVERRVIMFISSFFDK